MKPLRSILFSVFLIDSGQLLLKTGLQKTPISFSHLISFLAIFTNPFVLIGLLFIVASSVLWLTALSKTDLSKAYPMLSLGFAIVSIASYYLFNEQLSALRLMGIAIIGSGVFLMSRS